MVLTQSRFQQDLEQIITEVKSRAFHSYVQEYVDYPKMDMLSLHFTYLFLLSLNCSKDLREIYCVSQMLIQLGLDSHDQVGLDPIQQSAVVKERQLTILSGDLFSGCYYHYLAEKAEIELVRKWSDVVQEINVHKAALHNNREILTDKESEQKWFLLKGRLTTSVFTWFNASAFWHEAFTLLSSLVYLEDSECLEERIIRFSTLLQVPLPEWLKSELTLWLDSVRHTSLVSEP